MSQEVQDHADAVFAARGGMVVTVAVCLSCQAIQQGEADTFALVRANPHHRAPGRAVVRAFTDEHSRLHHRVVWIDAAFLPEHEAAARATLRQRITETLAQVPQDDDEEVA